MESQMQLLFLNLDVSPSSYLSYNIPPLNPSPLKFTGFQEQSLENTWLNLLHIHFALLLPAT
jgi:hypothetical protein